MEIKLNISEDFLVTGIIVSMKTDVVEFKPYFKATKTSVKTLTTSLGAFKIIIESYFNNMLQEGLNIPFLEDLEYYMQNITISTHEGLLLIDGFANNQTTTEKNDDDESDDSDDSDSSRLVTMRMLAEKN